MSRAELAKFTKNDLLCCTQSLELILSTLIAAMKIKGKNAAVKTGKNSAPIDPIARTVEVCRR